MTAKKRQATKRLRLMVFRMMADPQIDAHILIQNMNLVCRWIETGQVPRKDGKPELKVAASQ